MSLVTDDQVKAHRKQYLMRLKEHLIADDEYRMDARTKELLGIKKCMPNIGNELGILHTLFFHLVH